MLFRSSARFWVPVEQTQYVGFHWVGLQVHVGADNVGDNVVMPLDSWSALGEGALEVVDLGLETLK